jgi:hypothetical protein
MFNLVRRCIWVYLPVEAIMNRIWNYLGAWFSWLLSSRVVSVMAILQQLSGAESF